MNEIRADAKTIRQLLGGGKYTIDYYQREYRWETKQVAELIDDLAGKFLASYEENHERGRVRDYGRYFLGSIISSNRNGQRFLIDGQQRLTTLTLLLIHLHHLLTDYELRSQVAQLVFSQHYGEKSFNLDIAERTGCMEALYGRQPFDDTGQPESVRNIVARYSDIEDQFPEELRGAALPYFVDWLIENVHLVEITTYSDEDAYTVFETMNDRGLSLTLTDMLKGYLLANIEGAERRNAINRVWKERVEQLRQLTKEEDADAIKSWLRSQHAESIREHRRGAAPRDFDLIGTEFHRWVRDREEALGLNKSADFARFIEKDFAFYTHWYHCLRQAAQVLTEGLECVYYNAQYNFTLQYPVLLAPLGVDDSRNEICRKLRVTAAYLDILINRRIWNWRAIDYSTVQYTMFVVMRDIRGKSSTEVAKLLRDRLDADDETFATNTRFRLHGMNRRQIHRMLARMTDYVENHSGYPSHYTEYTQKVDGKGYEVEHIWSNHPERHQDEFAHANDFEEYRNCVGGLLLLPKGFNASYGDLPYEEKYQYYGSQNLLTRSLHELCYQHNPGFMRFVERSGLPFRPHTSFKKADLDARQELYRLLAEQIWDPGRLDQEAQA